MSCAQVMYHPYSSYFPYQRPVASAAAASPTAAAAASSSGQVPQQQQPSTAEPKKFAVPKMHETLAESGECSVASQSPASLPKEKDKGTHYVSANCVVFTYYSGDISAVVDEHFTRALSQPSSYSPEPGKTPAKDVPPMSQRNFPPSFWNSNYQPSAAGLSGLGAVPATPHSDMPYPAEAYHSGALHTIHQGDPWHYTLSPHAQATGPYTHRPSVHELSYSGMPSSRFSPQYGSLLLQPSVRAARLPTCTGLDKGDTWGTSRYHEPLSHVDTNYGATYGTMGTIPGLESQVQEPSKDLYWF